MSPVIALVYCLERVSRPHTERELREVADGTGNAGRPKQLAFTENPENPARRAGLLCRGSPGAFSSVLTSMGRNYLRAGEIIIRAHTRPTILSVPTNQNEKTQLTRQKVEDFSVG